MVRAQAHCQTLWRREDGATAVEFALVAGALLLTILFVMIVALILYYTQALDFAASKAARQVMIGNVQKSSLTNDAFRTQIVCPYLPAGFNCANVIVNLQTATEAAQPSGYYTFVNSSVTQLAMPQLNNASTQYSVGVQGSYEYLQLIYPITFLPSAFATVLSGGATYNGSAAYLVVSTAAFRNEQY